MRSARQTIFSIVIVFTFACGGAKTEDDAGSDTGVDSGDDAATDSGNDADSTDPVCPDDMVHVTTSNICIDRYEASQGSAGEAQSAQGAEPWIRISRDDAAAACEAAGKRLCEGDEWLTACQGVDGSTYPYGDTFDPERCNGPEQEVFDVVLSGQMSDCEGGFAGLFDMSGNVYEWTGECSEGMCPIRGGDYHDPGEVNHRCDQESTAPDAAAGYGTIGFRCCLTPS